MFDHGLRTSDAQKDLAADDRDRSRGKTVRTGAYDAENVRSDCLTGKSSVLCRAYELIYFQGATQSRPNPYTKSLYIGSKPGPKSNSRQRHRLDDSEEDGEDADDEGSSTLKKRKVASTPNEQAGPSPASIWTTYR